MSRSSRGDDLGEFASVLADHQAAEDPAVQPFSSIRKLPSVARAWNGSMKTNARRGMRTSSFFWPLAHTSKSGGSSSASLAIGHTV